MKNGTTLDVTKVTASEQELNEAKRRITECTACTVGKGTRTAFGHRGLDKGTAPGETIHMDTYFVQLENDGRKWVEYGTTASDPFSSWRWFFPSDHKDQITQGMIDVIRNAQTQFGCTVKRVYTDGGTEFINRTLKDFCRQHGIDRHHSPAGTQQLNGVAENAVGSNKCATRTLLAHGKVPMRFWKFAAGHATFVWNRTHISRMTGVTPYQTMRGRAPSARHWGVFGCDAFYHIPKEQRPALAPKLEPCIYLGHDNVQNCAQVYVLRTRKVIRSRDVTYRPDSFECGQAVRAGHNAMQQLLDRHALETGPESLSAGAGSTRSTRPPVTAANSSNAIGELNQSDEHPDQSLVNLGRSDQTAAPATPSTSTSPMTDVQWELDTIVSSRHRGRKGARRLEYLCRWMGDWEDTWEPAAQISRDASDAVVDFHQRHDPEPEPVSASGPVANVAPRRSPRLHQNDHLAFRSDLQTGGTGLPSDQTGRTGLPIGQTGRGLATGSVAGPVPASALVPDRSQTGRTGPSVGQAGRGPVAGPVPASALVPPAADRSQAGRTGSLSDQTGPARGLVASAALSTGSGTFGIDSMASVNVSGDRHIFVSMKRCTPIDIEVADGGIITATQRGTVELRVSTTTRKSMKLQFRDVYYHDRFAANLLSWGMLCKENWEFHSSPRESYLVTPGGNRVKLSMQDNISVLDCDLNAPVPRVFMVDAMVPANVQTLVHLHQRLGHCSFRRLVKLMKNGTTLDVTKVTASEQELNEAKRRITECTACTVGKGTRTA
ncbi:DDE-type integrase/transposase/recombinase, partial [Dyella sp.]|uniref:DDE-type integrase/transposase/recombinase n=1 Tax=Dyella sp. TaxID=1869338 RepID=UPI00284F619F